MDDGGLGVDWLCVGSTAWLQSVRRIGASGATAAGTERVYFDLSTSPSPWQWRTDAPAQWGGGQELDRDNDGTKDGIRLESDILGLERSWFESTGLLRTGAQPGYSLLQSLSPAWSPVEGFHNVYVPVGANTQFPNLKPEAQVAPTLR